MNDPKKRETSSPSPFAWKTGEPSIFAKDSHFTLNSKGTNRSQQKTASIERETEKLGRSPGTIQGLGKKRDRAPSHNKKRGSA